MSDNWDMEKAGPATKAAVVTPLDSSDLTDKSRAIFIGGSGNLKVEMFGGDIVTFVGMLAGQIYPIAVTKVFSGSTTATNIMALR